MGNYSSVSEQRQSNNSFFSTIIPTYCYPLPLDFGLCCGSDNTDPIDFEGYPSGPIVRKPLSDQRGLLMGQMTRDAEGLSFKSNFESMDSGFVKGCV